MKEQIISIIRQFESIINVIDWQFKHKSLNMYQLYQNDEENIGKGKLEKEKKLLFF